MPPSVLGDLQAAVTRATTVAASATTLIRGIGGRVQSAVDAAIANGATAEQLAPVQDEVNALNASITELGAAVSENTIAVDEPA